MKVLFCDLDGTLTKTISGLQIPSNIHDWRLRDDVMAAIKRYSPDWLCIITNQGGISEGYVHPSDFKKKLEIIIKSIKTTCNIEHVCGTWCSSNDKNDPRRKPNCGMIDEFKERHFNFCVDDIVLMIGDASGKGDFSDSDKVCAENAGIAYMDVNEFAKIYGY